MGTNIDVSADEYRADVSQSDTDSIELHPAPGVFRWLIGFFMLTKEDREKAGIYVGSEEHDL